jgi:hypothetical protein
MWAVELGLAGETAYCGVRLACETWGSATLEPSYATLVTTARGTRLHEATTSECGNISRGRI